MTVKPYWAAFFFVSILGWSSHFLRCLGGIRASSASVRSQRRVGSPIVVGVTGWGRGSNRSAGEERDRVSCREGVGRRGRANGQDSGSVRSALDDDTERSHETAAPERNVRVTSIAA